jgi:SAM-dependent methyltransferase
MADQSAEALWAQLMGFLTSQALFVAAEAGVADALAEGDLDLETLAARTGTLPGPLARVLRQLVSTGVFTEVEPGRFANSPLSDWLISASPASQRDFAVWLRRFLYPGAADLLHTARTGEPAFDHAFGSPAFDYMSAAPDRGAIFSKGMASAASLRSSLALAYAWPAKGTVVDVGGADGAILAAILAAHPGLDGVIFELAHLAGAALARVESASLTGRCRFQAGDFFEALWPRGDIYLLSAIVHDWDDEHAVRILRNCRRAMSPSGRLVLLEYVLSEDRAWHPGKVMDVAMLVMTTGRERTEREWRDLLAQAGFEILIITPSPRVSLIEARPA